MVEKSTKIVTQEGLPETHPTLRVAGSGAGLESLILASQIIDTLARYKKPVGVSTLALELNTSKARVSRFLSTMLDLGWVVRGDSGRGYSLGWQLMRFGQAATANNPVLEHVAPYLVELRNNTCKATIFATEADNNAIVTLSLRGTDASGIYVRPGAPLYFPRSSTARVMWAFRDSYMDRLKRLSSLDLLEGTHYKSVAELEATLKKTRETYLAATFNTKKDNLGAISTPVFGGRDELVGAIGMVMTSEVFKTPRYPALVEELRGCARELSRKMGSSRWPSGKLPVPESD